VDVDRSRPILYFPLTKIISLRVSMTKFILALVTLFSAQSFAANISLSGADYVPLLDEPARSCASQIINPNDKENFDKPGINALMGTVRMSWSGPGELLLDSMTISFTGPEIPNMRHDVVITGEELGFLWSGDNVVPSFKANSGRAVIPFCRFRAGPINVVDKYKYFEGIGIITVKGHYQENGQWKDVSGDLTFRYHMTPMRRP
jgi:hypothetical protein